MAVLTRRRALGLRPIPAMPSRPFGFNSSRLRAYVAARSACGEDGARRNGRGAGCYALACCGRLCQSVPSSTLAVRACTSRRTVHRHATRPRYGASTPRLKHVRRNLRHEAFSLVVGVLALPVSGRKLWKPSRGDAESATSPFGSGRPVRPWLVVNPGEGTAVPWASWPQPSSENNFPAAARLPRAANSFRFQVLHGVATAARCGQLIPRRPDHNKDALARPCSTRKEKHHG